MKNVLSILMVLNFLTLLNGQTNRLFYKSIFKQADGTPIKNMDLNVLIKISNYNGLDKYSECHIIRTDQNGYGYLWLGFGNDKLGKLENINFETEKHILKILLKDFQVYRWTDIYCTPFSKYPNLPESLHPSNIINESNIFYWGGIKLKALGIGYNNEVLSIEHDDNIEDKAYSDEIKAGKSFVEKLSDEEVIIKSSTNLKNYLQKGFVFDLLPQPNLLYSKSITIPNSNINSFQSKIGNLELNKIYYIRSYITYENDTIYGETAKFQLDKKINVQLPCPNVPKIFDIDGNSYNTVQIGNQCWTKENLKVTKFRDGSLIQIDESGDVTGSTTGQTWTSQTIGKRTIYANDKTKLSVYGYLYNWFVISDSRGICPIGWHVPEREELSLLINFLGGEKTSGSKLKEKSSTLWQNSNLENSNESGFSGFPGGIRGIIKGGYSGIGSKGVWWSSTKYDKDDAYKMELENNSNDAKVGLTSMMNGFSIRCIKDNLKNTNDSIPKISTIQITDVTSNSAQSGGSISSEGGSDIIAKGVVWSRSKRPDILTDSTTREGKGIGTFSSVLSDLISGKKYFVRAYATSKYGTSYGQELSFKTLISSKLPKVETSIISDITQKSAFSGGKILNDGDLDIITKGVVWSKNPNPKLWLLANKTKDGNGNENYISIIDKLSPFETYYVRAYATNSAGTGYGNELTFKTTPASDVPTLTTTAVSSIASKTAISGGNISSDGGSNITTRGVVWSTNPNPTVSLTTKTTNGNGIGSFTSDMIDLLANTTYYVRAYATNSAGTGYGNELTFKTTPASVVPTLTTTSVNSIASKTAVSGGNISSDGGSNVTTRGVVWSTSPNPTISLTTKTTDGIGIGSFTSNIIDLLANTTYYVRAYATNSAGTGYGNELTFKTTTAAIVPSLTTTPVTSITSKTAVSGGNISSDGGSNVTARGVVWSTSPNPTISLTTKTTNVSGIGSFTSDMIDLLANTTYYVRAYATNSAGTGYGNELTFKTAPAAVVPTLTTTAVSSITSKTAVSGGNILSDGGSNVTTRGVVWSTNPNPTISLTTKTTNGNGIGSFTSDMIDLLANTTYYVRAYATNSAGTGYGNELTSITMSIFIGGTPCPETQTVKDIDGNTYNTVQIGNQCWTKENLKVTKYKNGSVIPLDESGGTIGNGTGQIWSSRTTGARTAYAHNAANLTTYGYLYNWYAAADLRGICPEGWHFPTDAEWTNLTTYLGGNTLAGGKMKVQGTTYWNSPNTGGTNESGFTALPGGARSDSGGFFDIRVFSIFWSATEILNSSTIVPWNYTLFNTSSNVSRSYNFTKSYGLSVRCLKDSITGNTFSIPTITTTQVNGITSTSATSVGNITSDGGSPVTSRGVVWSTTNNPTIYSTTKTSDGTGTGTFSSTISDLSPNTTYYVRAYATNSVGTGYGNELTFKTTTAAIVPSLTTTPVTSITSKTAVSGGNISSDGGSNVTARGVVWSTSPNPTVSLTTKTTNGNGIGTFTSDMIDLQVNTTYYVRAYATNSAGTGYGNEISFRTLVANNEKGQPCSDIPSYKDIDGNTYNTVQIGTQCWTKENLRVSKYRDGTLILFDESGGTTGNSLDETWSERITGARAAYGNNAQNIVTYGYLYNWYTVENPKGLCPSGWHVPSRSEFDKLVTYLGGEEIAGGKMKTTGTTFWKSPNEGATNESGFSGLPGGYRDRKGEYLGIGLFGAYWSSTNIDINDPEVWVLSIESENRLVGWTDVETLEMGASIRCLKDTIINNTASLPTLTTTSVSAITSTSANTGGIITNDGGASITARGVVWSTNPNPTIALSTKTTQGTGIGSFTSILSNLTINTTYYVRAYATNSAGTGYGNELTFKTTTAAIVPTLTTTAVSSITSKTAVSGGNISSDGGSNVTARGVVWSTNPNPTVNLTTKTINGGGIGTFASDMVDLLVNTTYFVRAYAINGAGTGYGNEIIFVSSTIDNSGTSCPETPTLTDIDGNTYSTVQIGTQCWAKENLRVTKYRDGRVIPLDKSGGVNGDNIDETWSSRAAGGISVYWHDSKNLPTYGYLYNGFAVLDPSGICPIGWHIPSDSDWETLTSYLGGQDIAGGKMKTTGTTLWGRPNMHATNESGFSGQPGGYRSEDGEFIDFGSEGWWWSSVEDDNEFSILLSLGYNRSGVNFDELDIYYYDYEYFSETPNSGFSVRCLKDSKINTNGSIPTLSTALVTDMSFTSATTGGNIISDGGATITARGVIWSTAPNPTISLNTKTSDGSGIGLFNSSIKGLDPNTKYYVVAYATNIFGTGYGNHRKFISTTNDTMGIPCLGTPTVKDIDGNIYNTLQIGTQCWTKENLKVTKYRDGSSIPLDESGGTVGDSTGQTWRSRTMGARTVYGHDPKNLTTYGYLYNMAAVLDTKGICPEGWQIPVDTELGIFTVSDWNTLIYFLDPLANFSYFSDVTSTSAGGKMKTTGTTFWKAPNEGANNKSGFSGLPSGYRNHYGEFQDLGLSCSWWWGLDREDLLSSISLRYDNSNVEGKNDGKNTYLIYSEPNHALPVRCIKDVTYSEKGSIPTILTTQVNAISPTNANVVSDITASGGTTITSRGVVWYTSSKPTISLSSKTLDGTGIGTFNSSITSLKPNTKYYVRAYATNNVGTAYGNELTFTTTNELIMNIPCPAVGPVVKDIDGNEYNTVQIGTQCWLKENLRVTKYKDGKSIPLDKSGGVNGNRYDEEWSLRTDGARTLYSHDSSALNTYGYLYNWFVISNPSGICPNGWHVASIPEWDYLITFLGGESVAGGKMKTTGTTLWLSNQGATNESGFSGQPGGYRREDGKFLADNFVGIWWSSTENINKNAWSLVLDRSGRYIGQQKDDSKIKGASVRCLRD